MKVQFQEPKKGRYFPFLKKVRVVLSFDRTADFANPKVFFKELFLNTSMYLAARVIKVMS